MRLIQPHEGVALCEECWIFLSLAKNTGGLCAPYSRITARLNEGRDDLERIVTGRLFHTLMVRGIKEFLKEYGLSVGSERFPALRNF